jgi:predicted O-methyltransferase YrrM
MNAKPKRQEAARLRKFIERVYGGGIVRGEDGTQHPISPASITPDRGAFIRDICISEGATHTLEIGMAWGMSTLFILEALLENGAEPSAHLVTDPYESIEYHGVGRRNVKEVGLEEFVEIKEEAAEVLLPKLILQGQRFDFAFIDGSHLFDDVFVDLVFVHRLLKPGGVVVFDDTFADAVHLTCRFAETNYGYSAVADHQSGGARDGCPEEGWRATMRALRKPVEGTERGTFHFVPFFPQVVAQGGFAPSAWRHNDLTASTGAPRPEDKSGMTSYAFSSSAHVFYVDTNNHVRELWFDPLQSPGWNHRDLTASAGAPLPAAGTTLTSYSLGSSGHVLFMDASNHLHELWSDPAQSPGWNHNDLTASAGAPLPKAGTALTNYTLGSSGHVLFIDNQPDVSELYLSGPS